MGTRQISIEELDELLVVIENEDDYAIGPQDRRLLAVCVRLVRASLEEQDPPAILELDEAE